MTGQPPMDARWANFVGGFDELGRMIPTTYDTLVSTANGWPTTPTTPAGPASLLRTSRATFTLAWFHYELLVVAASWSLLAVESALRDRLGSTQTPRLADLIKEATAMGLVDEQDAGLLQAGRALRNTLVHALHQSSWTPSMADSVLLASHRLVAGLYPDDAAVIGTMG